MSLLFGKERIDVRVEVEDDAIVLVLPRVLDDLAVPWRDAWRLARVLEQAAGDAPSPPRITDAGQVRRETEQVKLTGHKATVVLVFRHTDRVRLSPDAARVVATAIRAQAQEVEFGQRVRFRPLRLLKRLDPRR